jgi:hypothetical protein
MRFKPDNKRKLDAGEVVANAKKQKTDEDPQVIAKCPEKRADIFAAYGIVIGTYEALKEIRYETHRGIGKERKGKGKGYQREHFIPNSCFMAETKRTGKTVPGAEGYSEGEAITYFVYDNQSQGTEHKFLTDKERDFAQRMQKQEKFATVNEWLDEMESATVDSLMNSGMKRGGDPIRSKSLAEPEAKLVAKCIREEYEAGLSKMNVKGDVKLGNPISGADARPEATGAEETEEV